MYCHSLMHAFILCITLYLLCHILYGLSEIKVYIYIGKFLLISVFETTALFNLSINSIFLWLLLPDLIGSLMRLL